MKFVRYRDGENTLEYRPVDRIVGIADTVNDEIQVLLSQSQIQLIALTMSI